MAQSELGFLLEPIVDDVRRAATLPGHAYRDGGFHEAVRERVLARAWHAFPGSPPERDGALVPWTLLDGCLDEPLLLAHDGAALRCLSNVCTHRGSLLVAEPCQARAIRCPYHGRRFSLDGRFVSAPGFDGAEGFPSQKDDLPALAHALWHGLAFASLAPAVPFEEWLGPLPERLRFLPLERACLERPGIRRYELAANWMLYCDNYLEGLHVPFVHRGLARALDLSRYNIELFTHGALQLGEASDGEPCFDLPVGHADYGRRIAAYYYWLFPCTMLNVYPWGMSINVVEPRGLAKTTVHYLSLVFDEALRGRGAGGDLHRVELEDQTVVHAVQRGVRARSYQHGRYAPVAEAAVHHFHRMLVNSVLRAPT